MRPWMLVLIGWLLSFVVPPSMVLGMVKKPAAAKAPAAS